VDEASMVTGQGNTTANTMYRAPSDQPLPPTNSLRERSLGGDRERETGGGGGGHGRGSDTVTSRFIKSHTHTHTHNHTHTPTHPLHVPLGALRAQWTSSEHILPSNSFPSANSSARTATDNRGVSRDNAMSHHHNALETLAHFNSTNSSARTPTDSTRTPLDSDVFALETRPHFRAGPSVTNLPLTAPGALGSSGVGGSLPTRVAPQQVHGHVAAVVTGPGVSGGNNGHAMLHGHVAAVVTATTGTYLPTGDAAQQVHGHVAAVVTGPGVGGGINGHAGYTVGEEGGGGGGRHGFWRRFVRP
jgi:hypothetical protein